MAQHWTLLQGKKAPTTMRSSTNHQRAGSWTLVKPHGAECAYRCIRHSRPVKSGSQALSLDSTIRCRQALLSWIKHACFVTGTCGECVEFHRSTCSTCGPMAAAVEALCYCVSGNVLSAGFSAAQATFDRRETF